MIIITLSRVVLFLFGINTFNYWHDRHSVLAEFFFYFWLFVNIISLITAVIVCEDSFLILIMTSGYSTTNILILVYFHHKSLFISQCYEKIFLCKATSAARKKIQSITTLALFYLLICIPWMVYMHIITHARYPSCLSSVFSILKRVTFLNFSSTSLISLTVPLYLVAFLSTQANYDQLQTNWRSKFRSSPCKACEIYFFHNQKIRQHMMHLEKHFSLLPFIWICILFKVIALDSLLLYRIQCEDWFCVVSRFLHMSPFFPICNAIFWIHSATNWQKTIHTQYQKQLLKHPTFAVLTVLQVDYILHFKLTQPIEPTAYKFFVINKLSLVEVFFSGASFFVLFIQLSADEFIYKFNQMITKINTPD